MGLGRWSRSDAVLMGPDRPAQAQTLPFCGLWPGLGGVSGDFGMRSGRGEGARPWRKRPLDPELSRNPPPKGTALDP